MGKLIEMPGVLRVYVSPKLLARVVAYCRRNPRQVRHFVEDALADELMAVGAVGVDDSEPDIA